MLLSLVALALVATGPFGAGPAADLGWLAVGASAVVTLLGGSLLRIRDVRRASGFSAVAGPDLAICFLVAAAVPFVLPALRFVRARA